MTTFINFLADQIDINAMASTALKTADRYTYNGKRLVLEALTNKEIECFDMDIWGPLLALLDHFQSWGWLSYTIKETKRKDEPVIMHISIDHKSYCNKIVKIISGINQDQ